MHRTTVWLSHEDDELLREISFRTRRTMSDLIREAVRLIGDRHVAAAKPAAREDIVSSRVMPGSDDWMFTPTEEAVISLRNAGLSPGEIAQDLALNEAQVRALIGRIDAKLEEITAPDEDPLSFAGT